jgi:diphosphomevalonate decarboxylase
VSIIASTSPSLALVKYWGKASGGTNIPATSSIAVGLEDLRTTTRLEFSGDHTDAVFLGGEPQPIEPYLPLIEAFRSRTGSTRCVRITSENDFPTAAGIASSSSGFAAIALGLDGLFETGLPRSELSAVARMGSGSAARAVYGGFTSWPAGSERAEQIEPAEFWPELRVVVAIVSAGRKPTSSRVGMNHTRDTSPIYETWIAESVKLTDRARRSLEARDLASLGEAMRESYLMMFSTMFTARPPFIYWLPESLGVIHLAEQLRHDGVEVYETMDAGPQVKLLTRADDLGTVTDALHRTFPKMQLLVSAVGGEPDVRRD